jgi:type IV pilus assembly protein PilA
MIKVEYKIQGGNKMRQILKNRKGVTLIELLAVIVILGIIAAIAVPTIGGLINRQEEKAAQATYDAIKNAAESYAEDSTPFTLADLVTDDFIDLKDNTFSMVTSAGTETLTTDIYITVIAGVVTFQDVDDNVATTFSINGHLVE